MGRRLVAGGRGCLLGRAPHAACACDTSGLSLCLLSFTKPKCQNELKKPPKHLKPPKFSILLLCLPSDLGWGLEHRPGGRFRRSPQLDAQLKMSPNVPKASPRSRIKDEGKKPGPGAVPGDTPVTEPAVGGGPCHPHGEQGAPIYAPIPPHTPAELCAPKHRRIVAGAGKGARGGDGGGWEQGAVAPPSRMGAGQQRSCLPPRLAPAPAAPPRDAAAASGRDAARLAGVPRSSGAPPPHPLASPRPHSTSRRETGREVLF